jgi:hypothetical protein
MSTFSNSPRLVEGGIVLIRAPWQIVRIISLQYNPNTLSRTLQMKEAYGVVQ